MEYFVLYLLGSVKGISEGLIVIGVIGMFSSCTYAMAYSGIYGKEFKFPKKTFSAFFSALVIATLLPTEKSLQYMAAYYVGKQAVQSETVQKLTELVTIKLDEEIKKSKELNSNR